MPGTVVQVAHRTGVHTEVCVILCPAGPGGPEEVTGGGGAGACEEWLHMSRERNATLERLEAQELIL